MNPIAAHFRRQMRLNARPAAVFFAAQMLGLGAMADPAADPTTRSRFWILAIP
jgi:hypothetical protein